MTEFEPFFSEMLEVNINQRQSTKARSKDSKAQGLKCMVTDNRNKNIS